MARLVIGVDVVGQKDVEALSKSLHNADEALRSWFRTSNAAGSDKLVAMSTATGKAFTELGAAALSSAKAVDAFFKGPNSTFFAREYGRAEAAVKSMEAAFRSLIATQAKQTMLEMPGVQRLLAEKKAIEANIAAYQKLRDAGDITGTYNSSRNYTSLAREFASEDAMIEHHIATLKAAEVAERQYASARNAGLAASMERNLSGREALRQGAYAVSDYSQRGRDRLAAGSKAGGYDYAKQMAKEAREANSWLAKMGFSFDDASKKGRIFNAVARETANITHSLTRGVAGASGGLWLTYGSILPMITGFAATASTLKSVNLGAEFDYMARSIQKLGGLKEGADNLNLIKGALYEISKDNVFSSNEMAEGVLEFARAGKTAADAVSNLGEVSKFAYLGEMELAKAVQLVVGQTSAFKGLTEAQAVNAMAVVADKTSISLQQMGEALKNTTSLGGVMGLQFEDVAIAIGQLGQSGIRGATAGAALTTMMYKLVEPTVKAQKAMKALGVEFSAFDKTTGRIKSLREIGTELNKATEGLTKAQKSSLFENLVGLRGIKALGALVDAAKEGTKQFENMKEAIDSSNQALAGNGGASYLASMMAAVEQSGKVQKDILTASFSDLFTKSYDNSSAVNAMKELRNVVTDKDTIEALQKIVTLMLQLTEMAAKAITITVNFASDVFGGPDFSSTAAKIGASVGASLAAAVTFYFTKNLKLSLAAATAGAAIGGSAGGNAGAIEPDFYKLGEMDENADRVYAFNAAIKEQERVYESASTKVKEYAKAQKLTTDEIKKLDYNAQGGGFRVLQETAEQAAGRIVELKKGLQTYEAAAATAAAGTSSFVDRLKDAQKSQAQAFSSEDGEALININKQLDIVREKVHAANSSKLDLLEEARSQELAEYSAKMDELLSKVVKQFGEGSDEVRAFNSTVAEGKDLINNMYDGQMADALQKDLKAMEQSWESYTAFAIQANNEVVQAAIQAATISVQKVVGIANGIVQTATVQAVDSDVQQVYSYIAQRTAQDKIKGLSKVDQVKFQQLTDEFNLSKKLFSGEEYADLQAKPNPKAVGEYFESLGKKQIEDYYRGTTLSAAAVRDLNEEERKLIDTKIDQLKIAAQGMSVNALKNAEDKLATKSASAGIKAENEALKQLRATITGYTNDAKDADKTAKDWLKGNDSTLKNMEKLNKSFAEFSDFQPFTQIDYDANDMLAKYTDDLEAYKKEQEELPALIQATTDAYNKAKGARDGFVADLAANGAGSSQEDINQLHAYDVAVKSLEGHVDDLNKRHSELQNLQKSGIQNQEQLNAAMADTKAFRMQMSAYNELGTISKETYARIEGIVEADVKKFEEATGDKLAAAELLYQRMLKYQVAVAKGEEDIQGLMRAGLGLYKIKVDDDALEFYKDAMPQAIDNTADAMAQFSRDVMQGNATAADAWRALGDTVSDVIFDIIQDMIKLQTKTAIMGIGQSLLPSFFGSSSASGGTSGGALTDSLNISSWFGSAKGNVFAGVPDLSAYSNSIVTKPTYFAKGGNVMGEAGPEAIMPLTRGSDGYLGVRATSSPVTINVNNNASGVQASANVTSDGNGGKTIEIMIDELVAGQIDRTGSKSNKALQRRGATTPLIRR